MVWTKTNNTNFVHLLFSEDVVSLDVEQETLEKVQPQEQHVFSARVTLTQTSVSACLSKRMCALCRESGHLNHEQSLLLPSVALQEAILGPL